MCEKCKLHLHKLTGKMFPEMMFVNNWPWQFFLCLEAWSSIQNTYFFIVCEKKHIQCLSYIILSEGSASGGISILDPASLDLRYLGSRIRTICWSLWSLILINDNNHNHSNTRFLDCVVQKKSIKTLGGHANTTQPGLPLFVFISHLNCEQKQNLNILLLSICKTELKWNDDCIFITSSNVNTMLTFF